MIILKEMSFAVKIFRAITVEDTAESLAALKSTTISTSELVLVTNGLTYILSIFCILLFLAALTEVSFCSVLGCVEIQL